jgi:hypothetical protein
VGTAQGVVAHQAHSSCCRADRPTAPALPLRVFPAFPPTAVAGAAEPCSEASEATAAQAELAHLHTTLEAARRREHLVLAIGDGSHDVTALWTMLPERTVLLDRTVHYRVSPELPAPAPGRGQPWQYGERALALGHGYTRAPAGCAPRSRCGDGRSHDATASLGRTCAPAPGAATQPLSLLMVKGSDQASGRQHQRRAPSFLLVNAVPERARRGGGAVLEGDRHREASEAWLAYLDTVLTA